MDAGYGYDANVNQTAVPLIAGSEMPDSLTSMSYDVSNRLTHAENNGATRKADYDYDAGNKRIWEKRWVNSTVVGEWMYFFGITGQRMGRYAVSVSGATVTLTQEQASVWFGGKLVEKVDGFGAKTYPSEDRLGSVGKYLPYGESKPGAANPAADNEKFATYTRDAGTGLDYADQRWHVPGAGRFLTADPYQASGGASEPGSWNRFGYVDGDPIGYNDPDGQAKCAVVSKSVIYYDLGSDRVAAEVNCISRGGLFIGQRWDRYDTASDSSIISQAEGSGGFGGALDAAEMLLVRRAESDAFQVALAALQNNSECREAFGTAESRAAGWDPRQALTSLFVTRDGRYGKVNYLGPAEWPPHILASKTSVAFTYPTASSGFGSINIDILIPTMFPGVGGIRPTYEAQTVANAATMLHEMAHLYNFRSFFGSGGMQGIGNWEELLDGGVFNRYIREKCGLQ